MPYLLLILQYFLQNLVGFILILVENGELLHEIDLLSRVLLVVVAAQLGQHMLLHDQGKVRISAVDRRRLRLVYLELDSF